MRYVIFLLFWKSVNSPFINIHHLINIFIQNHLNFEELNEREKSGKNFFFVLSIRLNFKLFVGKYSSNFKWNMRIAVKIKICLFFLTQNKGVEVSKNILINVKYC